MIWSDVVGIVTCVVTVLAARGVRVTTRPDGRPRRSAAWVWFLLALGLVTATSGFTIAHGPPGLHIAVALVALLLAPGYALVVPREIDDPADELTLALALSIALRVLAGTAMASMGFWYPAPMAAFSALVTAPVLTRHAVYHFLLPAAAVRVTTARD